jgi:hypothetical protein
MRRKAELKPKKKIKKVRTKSPITLLLGQFAVGRRLVLESTEVHLLRKWTTCILTDDGYSTDKSRSDP